MFHFQKTVNFYLPHSYSTINADILSGHVRACITCQEDTRPADIIRLRHASVHDLILPSLKKLRKL